MDDAQRRIEALDTELEIIGRDETAGYDVGERRAKVEAERAEVSERLEELQKNWDAEKEIVAEILDLRAQLRAGGAPVEEGAEIAPEGGDDATG